MMNLPIDVVPNTEPPRFKWQQTLSTPVGTRVISQESMLPPSVDRAVLSLVNLVKQLRTDNDQLRKTNKSMADRIAAQSELLSRKAEREKK